MSPDQWIIENLPLEFFAKDRESSKNYFKKFSDNIISQKIKVIIIGGTNGKGHVSSLIANNLFKRGQNVGLWSSPHILNVEERFWFNGTVVSSNDLLNIFNKNKLLIHKLSYYEFLFYQFCELALLRDLDYLVLEVGLGGRLDAVNYLSPDISAIVSIGRDHTDILGDSLIGILKEKFGIARKGKPLFSSVVQALLKEELKRLCEEKGSQLNQLEFKNKTTYTFRNECLALSILRSISKEKDYILLRELPKEFTLSRGQKVTTEFGSFILYGSHNLDGFRSLIDQLLTSKQKFRTIILGLGNRSKDELKKGITSFLRSPCLFNNLFLVHFIHPRAARIEILKELVYELNQESQKVGGSKNISLVNNPQELLSCFNEDESLQDNLVTGSNYFLSQFLITFNSFNTDKL